jgi:menaquinone-9 beta-reductase
MQEIMQERIYDTAIIGGGLAGLSLSIQLARQGYSVIVFEKETYPFHKVCGEYISNESKDFLKSLGLPLDEWELPSISEVTITSVNGKAVNAPLDPGGFGISRYKLDHALATQAKQAGVTLHENSKADEVSYDGRSFIINCNVAGQHTRITARSCCAAFGKRSNLDVKWNRRFLKKQDKKLDNYIGVKYHILTHWKKDLIGLHNFKNGYCGISKIEEGKYCLCYMTKAEDVKPFNGDLNKYESTVLAANPFLDEIFQSATFLPGFPVTIAQINFQEKTLVENGVIMLGDAAGMITPLCGNGMSMALRSSKIIAGLLTCFLRSEISYTDVQNKYIESWRSAFSGRMKAGRILQRFFGSTTKSNRFVALLKLIPILKQPLIRLTHGKPF